MGPVGERGFIPSPRTIRAPTAPAGLRQGQAREQDAMTLEDLSDEEDEVTEIAAAAPPVIGLEQVTIPLSLPCLHIPAAGFQSPLPLSSFSPFSSSPSFASSLFESRFAHFSPHETFSPILTLNPLFCRF